MMDHMFAIPVIMVFIEVLFISELDRWRFKLLCYVLCCKSVWLGVLCLPNERWCSLMVILRHFSM